jgi:hypothetical protein
MNKKTCVIIVVLLGAALVAGMAAVDADEAATAGITKQEVIDRFVAALGGREAIEKLDSRHCRGRVTDDLRSRANPYFKETDFEAWTSVPHRCRFDLYKEGFVDRRGFDGRKGWIADSAGVRRDEEAIRSKLAFLLDPQGALDIEYYFPELTYVGQRALYGATVNSLEPADLKPEYYTLYFDIESGLLVGIGYHWEVRDYRDVDGVMFPHRIVCGRKGGATTFDILEMQNNAVTDDSLFEMPVSTR